MLLTLIYKAIPLAYKRIFRRNPNAALLPSNRVSTIVMLCWLYALTFGVSLFFALFKGKSFRALPFLAPLFVTFLCAVVVHFYHKRMYEKWVASFSDHKPLDVASSPESTRPHGLFVYLQGTATGLLRHVLSTTGLRTQHEPITTGEE